MPACATCVQRKRDCDAIKPRCFQCKRSHLKCVYDPEPPKFEFRDETQNVMSKSSSHAGKKPMKVVKRRKDSQASSSSPKWRDAITLEASNMNFVPIDNMPFSTLEDTLTAPMDMPFDHHLDHDQLWDLSLQNSLQWTEAGEQGIFLANLSPILDVEEPMHLTVPDWTNVQSVGVDQSSSSPESTVSDHLLAQHYTRNLTSMYSSKNPGWNFHTYFFNRFSSKHPFVVSSIYAWTSAHLFCQEHLDSPANSMSNYEKCAIELKKLFNIDITGQPNLETPKFLVTNTNQDDLDAIAVSLYFLASTDLILSRSENLRNLLELEASILRARPLEGPDSVFIKIATWFCFLDARVSAFGKGHGGVIQAVGGERGMIAALHDSEDFLLREYKKLYPREERQRDQAHFPFYTITCRLVTIFDRISRFYYDSSDLAIQSDTRGSLDGIKKTLDSTSESKAAEDNVLSIFFTTSALYHAVEIYYSRTFEHEAPMYSANDHAISIIKTTDRYYQALRRPRTEPPTTKVWPWPLVFAAVEAKDSIYRGWAVQRIRDYAHAGKQYANSYVFVENILAHEERCQRRVDLAAMARSLGDGFVM